METLVTFLFGWKDQYYLYLAVILALLIKVAIDYRRKK